MRVYERLCERERACVREREKETFRKVKKEKMRTWNENRHTGTKRRTCGLLEDWEEDWEEEEVVVEEEDWEEEEEEEEVSPSSCCAGARSRAGRGRRARRAGTGR